MFVNITLVKRDCFMSSAGNSKVLGEDRVKYRNTWELDLYVLLLTEYWVRVVVAYWYNDIFM